MFQHINIPNHELRALIKAGEINLAGNKKLKIFGLLQCSSGKRMMRSNRVFFLNQEEAQDLGYRPCGNCMKEAYRQWKNQFEMTIP